MIPRISEALFYFMTIIRFGENKNIQWYETPEGRVLCDEKVINELWWVWVGSLNAKRTHTRNFTIFEFIKPYESRNDI